MTKINRDKVTIGDKTFIRADLGALKVGDGVFVAVIKNMVNYVPKRFEKAIIISIGERVETDLGEFDISDIYREE